MWPRIFIGGTGRSGTGILYRALGCHPDVYSLPSEMRFLVDPDGLMRLVDALTKDYSPVQAKEALFRFERLMRRDLTTPQHPPFLSFDFANWLGQEHYWQRLDQFCSDLVAVEYTSTRAPAELNQQGKLAQSIGLVKRIVPGLKEEIPHRTTFNWPRTDVKEVKYFRNRSELVTLAAAFVDDLFLHVAHEAGKQTWCEKTPQNIYHPHFLWELFPDSVFIHIKRDPRGVVFSIINQLWGPDDVGEACLFVKDMYDRWFDIERTIDPRAYRYLELKVEDLGTAPRRTLEEVAAFCGLENRFENLPDITMDKINYWQQMMTQQEIDLVNRSLGAYIEKMGYEI